MNKHGGFVVLPVIIVAILFLVFVAVFFSGYVNQDSQRPVNHIPEIIPTKHLEEKVKEANDFEWKTPEISKDYNWNISTIPPDSEQGSDYRIFLDSRYSVEDDSQFKDVILGGTLYKINLVDSDPKHKDLSKYIRDELSLELVELGWEYATNYGNWHVQGMGADGVFGSSIGFVKMNGNKIMTIVLAYDTKVGSWEGPGSEVICPCSLDARVFVSDVGEIDKYIY